MIDQAWFLTVSIMRDLVAPDGLKYYVAGRGKQGVYMVTCRIWAVCGRIKGLVFVSCQGQTQILLSYLLLICMELRHDLHKESYLRCFSRQ